MTKSFSLALITLACSGFALSQTAPQYGQCGGIGWTGPTYCPSGWACIYINQWYSQCLPGGTTTDFPITTSSTTTTRPPTTTATTTTTASGGVPTLVPVWNFIRAVTAPNFHKYLQSEVKNSVSDVVLGEATSAAQFQITNGQLVQNAGGTSLYAVVEPRADSTVTKLKVSWSKTPDTLGTFKFSGDTVEWSSTTVTRPQTNVCFCFRTFVITMALNGAYGYQTPAGCNDHTIH
ncbi:hypothetical protein BDN70DRAFT_902956 [Pholiota conissans]|uniref:CBM1 domain-containing protein n=1 Tax=Pholiota conissans TaxID=109636 RepID=A0A9P5ZGS9_9AGAR|nr:hypothetical protein BDN70DRAFT_902956 [Pholiota conissans]